MKNSLLATILLLFSFCIFGPSQWSIIAVEQEAGQSATFASLIIPKPDGRAQKLKQYLELQNSPMANDAWYFVWEADRLNLDWRLVAAIAGTESTFGKFIPYRSYNAWGWAVYTGRQSGANFTSWKHGITTVSEGLRYNYIDKGAESLEQIGRRYAASPRWTKNVNYFLTKIDSFTPKPEHIDVIL